ncbi:MAG: alanine racemase [Planctomycetota bacterium]
MAENIDLMLALSGDQGPLGVVGQRLRPHLKTHKSDVITRMQLRRGISRFKASTLGEVAMAAGVGAHSVLLAHQPVGVKIEQFVSLCGQHPDSQLAVVVDDLSVCDQLSAAAKRQRQRIDVYIDVDCGMHRTGVPIHADQQGGVDVCSERVETLANTIATLPALRFAGLHAYDGHLHQPDLRSRRADVDKIVADLMQVIESTSPPTVIVAGSPTFACWADAVAGRSVSTNWELSPGTCLLWDWGYGDQYEDLPFQIAAGVLATVVSLPTGPVESGRRLVCLDTGTKAIASEMPMDQRVRIVGLPDAQVVAHNEEHLVVSVKANDTVLVGRRVWVLPKHICPTMARFDRAILARQSPARAETIAIHGRQPASIGLNAS